MKQWSIGLLDSSWTFINEATKDVTNTRRRVHETDGDNVNIIENGRQVYGNHMALPNPVKSGSWNESWCKK